MWEDREKPLWAKEPGRSGRLGRWWEPAVRMRLVREEAQGGMAAGSELGLGAAGGLGGSLWAWKQQKHKTQTALFLKTTQATGLGKCLANRGSSVANHKCQALSPGL